jgi:hypothetical protein
MNLKGDLQPENRLTVSQKQARVGSRKTKNILPRTELCTKRANVMLFLCGPLRISASFALKIPLIAENAEIRRGPQRRARCDFTFLCCRSRVSSVPPRRLFRVPTCAMPVRLSQTPHHCCRSYERRRHELGYARNKDNPMSQD